MRTFLLVLVLLAIVLLCGASFVVHAEQSASTSVQSTALPGVDPPPSAVVMLVAGIALARAGFALRRD
jgi:hypothetical protein